MMAVKVAHFAGRSLSPLRAKTVCSMLVCWSPVLLCACQATDGPSTAGSAEVRQAAQEELELGHDEQHSQLVDGAVTTIEYETAVGSTQTCLVQSGFPTPDAQLSPLDNLRLLLSPELAGKTRDQLSTVQDECQATFLNSVESFYLGAHTALMDPALLLAVEACVAAEGVEPPQDASNMSELLADTNIKSPERSTFFDCAASEMHRLFPAFTTIVIND